MTVERAPFLKRQEDFVKNSIPTVLVEFSRHPIEPSYKKTPKTLEVEKRYGGTPIEELFDKWYWELNMSIADIAREIDIPSSTFQGWTEILNLALRSKREAVSLSWQDPQKRANRIAATQSKAANEKRASSLRAYFAFNTKEVRSRRTSLARKSRAEAWERKKQVLGKHPGQALRNLVEKKNLSDREIADRLRSEGYAVSKTTVRLWRNALGIPARRIRARGGEIKPADKELVKQARELGGLGTLTDREYHLVQIRFPSEGRAPTLEQIARKEGVTREAIRQRQKRALGKLKELIGDSEEHIIFPLIDSWFLS